MDFYFLPGVIEVQVPSQSTITSVQHAREVSVPHGIEWTAYIDISLFAIDNVPDLLTTFFLPIFQQQVERIHPHQRADKGAGNFRPQKGQRPPRRR